jgi:predicted NAD-dependent protein-ADP-ribosyltransferase YbiA (DUF1768 family)
MALMFIVGGTVGPLGSDARRAGSKESYMKYGAELDQSRWSDVREDAQQRIIDARLQQDALFRSILLVIGTRQIRLVHFDRSGMNSYWGATVNLQSGVTTGSNRLGILLMETAARLRDGDRKVLL